MAKNELQVSVGLEEAHLDEKTEKALRRNTFLAGAFFVFSVIASTGYGVFPDRLDQSAAFEGPDSGTSLAVLRAELWHADYDLSRIKERADGVPRYFVATWPRDWANLKDREIRKQRFIKLLLPLILQENEKLLSNRKSMMALAEKIEKGESLHRQEESWRARIAIDLRLEEEAVPEEILKHLDVVPPSLALAQSAIETGWGSSRFVREGNALFGEWGEGEGMIPQQREEGRNHVVRRFGSLGLSVTSYMRNLNTHAAYEEFRKARALLRKTDLEPDGEALALTLKSYSEQGEAYLALVGDLISDNDLAALDRAELTPFSNLSESQIAENP